MKSMASCARCSRPRRGGGVAELVNAIERDIFSRFRFWALGLAVGDPSPLGLEDWEQQQGWRSLGRQHAGWGDRLGIGRGG